MHEEGINTVVVMSSAQVGKTELILNALGYFMQQDPAPMLVVQPTLQMAEAFSKDRLAPMIRDTPVLTGLVREPRARNSNNTLLHKTFPGGHVTLAGANSPAGLAMRPVRGGLFDEIDRYPVSAGSEGDPVSLGTKRTTTFHNRFRLLTSTPTVKGASRIEAAYLASDQRKFYVPCPHCGTMQPLLWANLHWGKGEDGHGWDGKDPWLECDDCGGHIDERHKMAMLRGGRWVAEAFAEGVAGFHLSELYSPWSSWRKMVADWYAAKGDSEMLRAFVNTSLGETFEETGKRLELSGLMARREEYAAEVPAGGLVLVAGVDVQDNRLEVQVRAYGIGEESWRITRRILWGNPAEESVWRDLDDILIDGRWTHEAGGQLRVAAACIDSGGHHTKRVYEYVRLRPGKRIFATVGRAGFGRAMVSSPSHKRFGKDRRPVELFIVGVDEVKRLEHARLRKEVPGPGYCHFPLTDEFDQDYFDQLASEELRTKKSMGVATLYWHQVRERNEALDMSVLDYAAMTLLKPNFAALAVRMSPAKTGSDDGGNDPEPTKRTTNKTNPVRRRGGFVNRW